MSERVSFSLVNHAKMCTSATLPKKQHQRENIRKAPGNIAGMLSAFRTKAQDMPDMLKPSVPYMLRIRFPVLCWDPVICTALLARRPSPEVKALFGVLPELGFGSDWR